MAPRPPPSRDVFADRLVAALEAAGDRPVVGSYRGRGALEWQTGADLLGGGEVIAEALQKNRIVPGEACLVVPAENCEPDVAAVVVGCIIARCPVLVLPPIDSALPGFADIFRRTLCITRSRFVILASGDVSHMEAAEDAVAGIKREPDIVFLGSFAWGFPLPNLAIPEPVVHKGCRVMQLTSGTTGTNRVCLWQAEGMLACMQGIAAAMQLRAGDVLFGWSGLHHTVGILNTLLLGLYHGVPAVFMSAQRFARDPAEWLRGIHESGATITSAPNFALQFVASHVRPDHLDGVSLARLRAVWNTGERVTAAASEGFYQALRGHGLQRAAVRANYGSAENSGGATFCDVEAPRLRMEVLDREALQQQGLAVVVDPSRIDSVGQLTVASVGAPWPGLELVIRDDAGRRLPDGRVGEVALRSPSRFAGYCYDPDATAAVLEGDLLLTGDLGYRRDGELFWIGRTKESVVVRGRKIDPSEFLTVLEPLAGIRPGACVAFGVDDETSGTQRVVVAVEAAGADADARSVVRDVRRAVLHGLGVAANDVLVLPPGTLVTTISGKRRHRHYKELYLAGGLEALRLDRQR